MRVCGFLYVKPLSMSLICAIVSLRRCFILHGLQPQMHILKSGPDYSVSPFCAADREREREGGGWGGGGGTRDKRYIPSSLIFIFVVGLTVYPVNTWSIVIPGMTITVNDNNRH